MSIESDVRPASRERDAIVVRHLRQLILWPLQLVLQKPRGMHRPWEGLASITTNNPWQQLRDEFERDPEDFQERHYQEFITFLPFVQRFLYGSSVGRDRAEDGEPSIRVFRRRDIARVRNTYADGVTLEFGVVNVDLYFFLDVDVAIVAFEMYADDLPLERVQETLFRFGRAYPRFWDGSGHGGNCLRLVEWLDTSGAVLATSDYDAKRKYLRHVGEHRAPCLAAHWEYLLRPLTPPESGDSGVPHFRQLEYYRMPFMAYLSLDDPTALTRSDFVRLALCTQSGAPGTMPFSEKSLEGFESNYCDDRYWGRDRASASGDTRILVSGRVLAVVGRQSDAFFAGRNTGLLGQFRHQFLLLFLIVHFHRAALLSLSDQLAVAMNRLVVGDTESVKRFKRGIRRAMEVFLRFTHRYWYHEVSDQDLARSLFSRLARHLDNETLYDEVRHEMLDMSDYLDSDSMRRQANTILRLTVVTIFAMIATIGTGFLGMNLIAAADQPFLWRVVFFLIVLVVTGGITAFTIIRSKRLADLLDVLSDERVAPRLKLRACLDSWRK
jgi:hypothetical protein